MNSVRIKKHDQKDSKFSEKNVGEMQQLKNQLARSLADYDNLRKRTEVEREIWMKFASERILITLLSVLDNLESVQKHITDPGLAIAICEFRKVFGEEGLEEIVPKLGEKFNHGIHEAVEVQEGGEKGTIADIMLNGWKFKDGKVIRFAKVKVYKSDK